jgi:hypothetical protein
MRTPKQIEASRVNGSKSHGPAQTIVVEGESQERFRRHLDSFIAQYEPADQHELELVEHMAVAPPASAQRLGLETAGISDAIRELTKNSPKSSKMNPRPRLPRHRRSHR